MKTNEVLKQLRNEKQLSQSEMADAINVSLSSYQKYEREKNTIMPSIDVLIRIAEYHNVSVDCLLGREPAPDPFGEYDLTDATEDEVIEAFLALPPKIRACILDIMAQLGGVVESSRTPSDAESDEYEEITLGEIEDARNAEIQTYEKDAG